MSTRVLYYALLAKKSYKVMIKKMFTVQMVDDANIFPITKYIVMKYSIHLIYSNIHLTGIVCKEVHTY